MTPPRRPALPGRPARPRRATTLALALLAGSLAPLAMTSPAHAEAGCLSEVATGGFGGFGGERCDDSNPPITTLDAVTPLPAEETGFITVDSVRFDFTAAYDDEDGDPIVSECKFYVGTEPEEWTECTSPVTYTDLRETSKTPYTFKVRSYDEADEQIDATAPTNPLFGTGGAELDLSDIEDEPQEATFLVDTIAPQTYIFNEPYDADSPELPMVTTDSPALRLASSETGATFDCLVNDRPFACHGGNMVFEDLPAGLVELEVVTTDVAGNVDPEPATTAFTMPADIELPKKRWTERPSRKAFGGSFIETTKRNARFAVKGEGAREVRLIATKRPGAGVLKYKVPKGSWRKIKMNAKSVQRGAVIIVRNPQSGSFTGKIKFRTFSKGRSVEVDAIMVR